MAKDWIMVRLERCTWDRLDWIRNRMLDWYTRTGQGPPGCADGTLSLNTVIQVLLGRYFDHRDRAKRSKAKKRAQRPPDGTEARDGPIDL
jgi:hypothetical protein